MQTEAELDLPDAPPPMSLFEILPGVLFRPRATFAEIFGEMAQPGKAWLLIALLALLLAGASAALNTSAIMQRASAFIPGASEQTVTIQGSEVQSSQPVSEGSIPVQEGGPPPQTSALAVVGGSVGTLVAIVAGWFVWAVGLLLGGTLTGGRSTFGNVFKMVVLAATPLIVRSLVQVGALAAGSQPVLNPGFAGFVPIEAGALNILLRSLLGSLDVFQLWNLALLVIGTSVVSRMAARKAVVLVLVIGIIIVLLSSAPAIVLGGFATSP
jgi:hypothetical protein